MFALFSGSHFDPSEHLRRSQISVDRSFRPAGTGRQTAAIMASPDRTPALRQLDLPALVIHGLMDKLVRAERWHGNCCGDSWLAPVDVP